MYNSPNIIRLIKSSRLRLAYHIARMEEGRSAFKVLTDTRTPAGKILLGRSRRRWMENNRMDLKEIVINTRNLFDSAQDRDAGSL